MSFFSRLFGSSGGDKAAAAAAEEDYKDFHIVATPQPEGGQFRLHGTITKEINGEERSHTLIRADIFASRDECATFTLRKAKQVIDEQGDRLFD